MTKKVKTLSLLAASTALFFASATPAFSQSAQTRSLEYNVFAGGVEALRADFDIAEKNSGQTEIDVEVETDGFIGTLFPWEGTYKTIGANLDPVFRPDQHTSTTEWRGDPKYKTLTFQDGRAVSYSEVKGKDRVQKNDIAPEMTENAVDLLSGLMILFNKVEAENTCNTAATVFDGKRKFNVQLTDPVQDQVTASEYSRYTGPALRCTITVVPLEGFSERDQDKGWMAVQNHTAKRGKLPQIWFADLFNDSAMLPVRMEINSAYGGVVAHLAQYSAE
tara:strand:- start:946 stop:1776 length:831 start_codon:yes stop_codon:yes gene_type:complete